MTDATTPSGGQPLCLTCGEPHDFDQQYCLECGARLPAAPSPREDTPIWAWTAVVTLALVAIVSGIVVALLASSDDADASQVALVAQVTTVQPAATEAPEPTPAPEPPVTVPIEGPDAAPPDSTGPDAAPGEGDPELEQQPPVSGEDLLPGVEEPPDSFSDPLGLGPPQPPGQLEPSEPTPPSSPPAPSSAAVDWPSSTDGFTVILSSVPESLGRSQADSRAARARSEGLDEVGVLRSADYDSLRQGYWVTFSGVHDTLNAARAELAGARAAGFPTAYTRRVAG